MVAAGERRQEQLARVTQLAAEADLGRVVPVDRHPFDRLEKVAAGGGFLLRVVGGGQPCEQIGLLGGARRDEVLLEERAAASIDPGEAAKERGAVRGPGFLQHPVDEPVDARRLGAGRVGLGNDQLGQRHHQLVLPGVEHLRHPVLRSDRRLGGVRVRLLAGQRGQ
jgi:hypothetical protein